MAKNAKKQQVKMPVKMTQRLTAAVAMLLVSTIMLVSATYAWFTLSTAPEVTGITTQVGANGNLEIALLNTATFADTSTITSTVGDSMDVADKDVMAANITWGNLVDLSTGYHLNEISLMPAALSADLTTTLLKIASYGKDGRVKDVNGSTVSAIYNGGWKYNSAAQTYGVRAIGTSSDVSNRQLIFNSARTAYSSNLAKATGYTANAVNANVTTFITLALAGEAPASFTATQKAGLKAMAQGVQASFNAIVNAYANAGLATAASTSPDTINDAAVETLKSGIATVTDASELKDLLHAASVTTFDDALDDLAELQAAVAGAVAEFDEDEQDINNNVVTPLLGDYDKVSYDEAGNPLSGEDAKDLDQVKSLNLTGGAIQALASYTGTFYLTEQLGITVYAGAKDTPSSMATVSTTVNNLTPPAGETETLITDTYGYVIDFAFRTNAADSKLQLQTEAANRYMAGAASGTQGQGSVVTYTYAEGATDAQAQTLLGAINLVFFDPELGTIYAQATLTDIAPSGGTATANVTLTKDASVEEEEKDDIVALQQNQPKKVSVLVYLDGSKVDNTAVLNAASSGSLNLNLQFSSSATLHPMENTALKQLEATT